MKNEIVKSSILNLRHSYNEISLATHHLNTSLVEWEKRLFKTNYLFNEEKNLVYSQYKVILKEVLSILLSLDLFKKDLNTSNLNNIDLDSLINDKEILFSRLRITLSEFASLMTCLNWQSPSIKSSKSTRIGIEKYPIETDWNDYKRDRSGDTFYCEEIFEKNILITKNNGVKPVLNLFSSGMAAFTAIIYFLICENIVKGGAISFTHNYIESKMLLTGFFKNKLRTFDDTDTESIVRNILTTKPNVVFLEPLSNTNNLHMFDVLEIINRVSRNYKEEIYFILDLTCILGFENILDNFTIPSNIKIIQHGSLLKSPQLGMERVNVGFVQTFGLGTLSDRILDYRTLSGTNIQDFATNLIPYTTKSYIQTRMKIIEANAINLANFLMRIDPNHNIFAEIIYPGTKIHKDYSISKKIGFAGTFVNIKFVSEFNKDKYFELFTKGLIDKAKDYNCDIVHGASFGFNHTSIYYSVGWEDPKDHYLRLSLGTETSYEMEKIKKVFNEVFLNFKKNIF